MKVRWLSVDEIGVYLGVERNTAYKWISQRGMHAQKVGPLWKFKRDEGDRINDHHLIAEKRVAREVMP